MTSRPRLLYLGFAFPPGVQALHPHINPAGHAFEVQMVAGLRPHFDLRTVGLLPVPVPCLPVGADPSSGIEHHLVLEDQGTFGRRGVLQQLQQQYRLWTADGWRPDTVLTYNLSPVFNGFVRQLRRERVRPRLVLLLADSSQLGRPMRWLKRFRYRFKPLTWLDTEMIGQYDAGIGLSREVRRYFTPRGIPFLWMPGGCSPSRGGTVARAEAAEAGAEKRPIRFGYFGALAEHAGILPFAQTFLAADLPAELHICGYGRLAQECAELARRDARCHFHGLLPTPDDCLRFGRSCDVLVNPRPATHGNENNFPSKVFEYALCGRAILSTRLSGVDDVLGDRAWYYDANEFSTSLTAVVKELAGTAPAELHRRGELLRERVGAEFNWPRQAERMAEFILASDDHSSVQDQEALAPNHPTCRQQGIPGGPQR